MHLATRIYKYAGSGEGALPLFTELPRASILGN
jgi:hypothetical protein